MASLRRRLDIILSRMADIRDKLQDCHEYPPCCLTLHNDNRISCDMLGPMPEKAFLVHCKKCKSTMKALLDRVHKSLE